MAMIAGGACGVMTLVGGLLLPAVVCSARAFAPPPPERIFLILSLLMVQCTVGLLDDPPLSAQHMDGSE